MDVKKNFVEKQKMERVGHEQLNNQGCLMKIIEYKSYNNIIVEFQDEYKTKVYTTYGTFLDGNVKNPYHPSIYDVGIVGNKYPLSINKKQTKEYIAWKGIIQRCYDDRTLKRYKTYKDATCCEEWLLFENFYKWIHSQSNFNKWLNGNRWAIDKDIIVKGSKVYSPETCCLVPQNVNMLFVKSNETRGDLPIGVYFDKKGNKYRAECHNPFTNKTKKIGRYSTSSEAFNAYKTYKDDIIKQVAKEEYNKGNITEKCYEAMMNYEVEITD